MSFLAPLFFVALGALAVPVIIHLIQRERNQSIQFPSLMFIRRIPYQSVRRRRIRHWALLLLRLAALLLIVLAFARPFLRRPAIAASRMFGAREVAIVLDRSYSMGYGDRWDRARAAARQAVRALGPNDRGTLIAFGRGADAEIRSTTERAGLLSAIDRTQLSADVTRYGPALKLAQSVLDESTLSRLEMVLISDFQKAGWKGAEGVHLPAGTVVTTVPINEEKPSNVTLASPAFKRDHDQVSGRDRIAVSAVLVRRGGAMPEATQVALEVEGRQLGTQSVTIEPNGTGAVTFPPFQLFETNTRGTLRTGHDALAPDNAMHFVLSPVRPISILIVDAPGAADGSLYLRRALTIGDPAPFQVDAIGADRLTGASIENRSAVIVNDAPLSRAMSDQLRNYAAKGGGVLVVVGGRTAAETGGPLLPGAVGASVRRDAGRDAVLGGLDYSHPVFEVFKAPRSGDFSAARFFEYRSLTVPATERVLARFDDGAPALVESRPGRGHLMIWASTLDNSWNDLPVKPVFLPFVHQVVTYLSGYTPPVTSLTVGQVIDPLGKSAAPDVVRATAGGSAQDAAGRVVLTPKGERIPLDQGPAKVGWAELADPGFYEIHSRGVQETRPLTVAANVDVAESDLTPLDPRELVGAISGQAADPKTAAAALAPPTMTAADQERQQSLWWFLLLAGVVLLAVESFLANRLSRGASVWR